MSIDLYDIAGRLKALEKEQAETRRKFDAEAEVIRALPPATPASLKFIYTHGLDRPLYGASLGLGFKIESLDEVPAIVEAFKPAEASFVKHGSKSSPYRSIWPNSYAGAPAVEGKYSDNMVHERTPLQIPIWYECEEYGEGRVTEKVKWYHEMTLETLGLRVLRVDCEVQHPRGRFSNPPDTSRYSRRLTPQTRYPVKESMPRGEMFGTYGNLMPGTSPRVTIFWPEVSELPYPEPSGWPILLTRILGLKEGDVDAKRPVDND